MPSDSADHLYSTNSKYLLPDPTSFELAVCPTIITVALDSTDPSKIDQQTKAGPKIRLIRQEGMGGYAGKSGMEVVGECLGAAKSRVRELSAKLYES